MRSPLTPVAVLIAAFVSTSAGAIELTPEQVQAAGRVHIGETECEFKQTVRLEALDEQPGQFELTFKKVRVVVVPEETSTGAVRLVDSATGLIWIQIPAKSMLLDSRKGQRIVDGCVSSGQRADAAAAATPGNSFGLSSPNK